MSTDRLATLLPRLVVARKSRVRSTLAGLHGAGNLHHGGDDDDDGDHGDDDEVVMIRKVMVTPTS